MAAALLFASGAAALIFQVLWIKQLTLVVGVDVYAVSTGVSAFFFGLALGSAVFGRIADCSERPYRLYSAIEIATALLGSIATLLLPMSAGLFARIEDAAGPVAWILPVVLVGFPAFFMGGTLPVLVRAVNQSELDVAGARRYAANTAGAIAGALAAPFVLIPALGVRGSAFAAAALNLSAAGIAWMWPSLARAPAPALVAPSTSPKFALALYAISGGIALGYEVVWSQAIVPLMSTRAFAFAVVLATYLAGLAIGSMLYSRYARKLADHWGAFAILIAGAGLIAIAEMATFGHWIVVVQTQAEAFTLELTGSALAGMCARFATAAAFIVFLPTVLLGAAFPAALRLTGNAQTAGRDVGGLVAWNTLGGIAGTILAGFLLAPSVGLVRTLAILAVLATSIGTAAIWRSTASSRGVRMTTYVTLAATVVVGALTPHDKLAQLLPGARDGQLRFYEESAGGTVAVVEPPGAKFRRLYIQGVSNSGDAMPSLRYMRLQALLPLLIHAGEPKSALVIGFGTGITAGALTPYAGLERRVVAELLPAVVHAAPLFKGNFVAASSSLDLRIRDGRRELLRSSEHYDLITLEPPPPSAAGVVNLYSRDFYALAASRLNPQGIVAQWLPLPTQNEEDSQSLIRSFVDAFPHATLWTTELHEMLLVGSYAPIELDVPRITARFSQPKVAAALQEVGVATPAAVLATYITDRDGLMRYTASALPVTDDRPRIEYATWVRGDEIVRVLPALLQLTTEPPLRRASDDERAAISIERVNLFEFYAASLAAYERDRAKATQLVQNVFRRDPGNPYYRWFAPK